MRKRRVGRRSARAPMRSAGSAAAHLAVVRNPFSVATANPVFPDGKANLSAGQRFQVIQEFVLSTTAGQPLVFMLFPGLGNGLTVFFSNVTGTVGLPYTKQIGWSMSGSTDSAGVQSYTNAEQNATNGEISRWRVVSQGLRLSLTNNSDQNDGWWETIRFTLPNDPTLWCLSNNLGDNSLTTDYRMNAAYTGVIESNINGNFADNLSYRSGKLRDIHKTMYQLKPISTTRDFKKVQVQYNFDPEVIIGDTGDAGGTVSGGVSIVGGDIVKDTSNTTSFVDANFDDNFDVVLVRVHGRPAGSTTSTTDQTATRLLAHLTCNQEIQYADGTLLEKFHMAAPVASEMAISQTRRHLRAVR